MTMMVNEYALQLASPQPEALSTEAWLQQRGGPQLPSFLKAPDFNEAPAFSDLAAITPIAETEFSIHRSPNISKPVHFRPPELGTRIGEPWPRQNTEAEGLFAHLRNDIEQLQPPTDSRNGRQLVPTQAWRHQSPRPPGPDATEVPNSLLGYGFTASSLDAVRDIRACLDKQREVEFAARQTCRGCGATVHSMQTFCMHCGLHLAVQPRPSYNGGDAVREYSYRHQAGAAVEFGYDKSRQNMAMHGEGMRTRHDGAPRPNGFGNAYEGFGIDYEGFMQDSDDQMIIKDEEDGITDGFCGPIAFSGVPTTLMIRNIPPKYTQETLVLEWPNHGTYDFFYLPYSCSTQQNLTYAFINFTSHEAALQFKSRWEKRRLNQFSNRKPLTISCADVQGRDENIWQLKKKRNWRLRVKQCQPLICDDNGHQISLAEAFRSLVPLEPE
jgi:hypothetical protein